MHANDASDEYPRQSSTSSVSSAASATSNTLEEDESRANVRESVKTKLARISRYAQSGSEKTMVGYFSWETGVQRLRELMSRVLHGIAPKLKASDEDSSRMTEMLMRAANTTLRMWEEWADPNFGSGR